MHIEFIFDLFLLASLTGAKVPVRESMCISESATYIYQAHKIKSFTTTLINSWSSLRIQSSTQVVLHAIQLPYEQQPRAVMMVVIYVKGTLYLQFSTT